MVEVLQESIVPERLPAVAGVRARRGVPARRRRPSTSVATGTTRSRSTVARSSSSSVTSPATASRPPASWAGSATACAPTRSMTPIRPILLRRAHEMLRRLDPDSMVTAVVACYEPDDRGADVVTRRSSAAAVVRRRRHHPLPRRRERDAARHDCGKNFATAQVTLTDGALLVLYTDGLDRTARPAHRRRAGLARRARTRESRDEPLDDAVRRARRPVVRVQHPSRRRHLRAGPARLVSRAVAVSILAIDIGGTKLAAGIVTDDGRAARAPGRRRRRRRPTRRRCSPRSPRVVDTRRRRATPTRVGVGCGGPMDRGGEHVSPLNIPAWRGFPLRARLAAHTGLPVVGRQRRQGARARRRLDRRGARRARLHRRWSCRPASAAASCSTAACSTAPAATPGTSAT